MSDTRRLPAFDSILQDLRYTFRTLRRDSGFTAFAVLIVGLGVGASATVFSVVDTLLLRPLPFHEPERLVWMANHDTSGLSGQTTQVGLPAGPPGPQSVVFRLGRLLRFLRRG